MTRRTTAIVAGFAAVLGTVLALASPAGAQSSAPDTSGSDPVIVIVGVLLVTGIAVFVTARLKRRP